ncbi:MAG: CDP-alcohol phosphatidyltransferase family protein [Thermofilum sp.]|nr:CDP-alcohol phosphatidyltransferase family protein [Thermofilum sp.]
MRRKAVLRFRGFFNGRGGPTPVALLEHFGTPVVVRWISALKSLGFTSFVVAAERGVLDAVEALLRGVSLRVEVEYFAPDAPLPADADLLVEADYLVEPGALRRFVEGDYARGVHAGKPVLEKPARGAGRSVELDELAEPRHRPACVYAGDLEAARRALVRWAQKGVHFTSVLNAPLENALVRLLGDCRAVTPNRVTLAVNALSLLAVLLFANGQFLPAAAFSYLLGILDGVDGKLARVRGVLTKFGHLEHSLDALYEQALYASFALGLALHGYGFLAAALGTALLVVDCFVRHVYNQFALTAGKPLKHYTPLDRAFAFVDGRRNVYLIYAIAFSAAGHPLLALLAALTHASLTAIVYFIRAACHLRELDEREGTAQLMRLSTHSRKRSAREA